MKYIYTFRKVFLNTMIFVMLFTCTIAPLSNLAFAQTSNSDTVDKVTTAQGFSNPIKATSLSDFLTQLLKVITTIGAIVVVIFLILAGFKYVTARGDTKQIEDATKTLTWTVIGAMVLLGAQVIATAIQGTINELQ